MISAVFLESIIAVIVVSLISFVGIFTLSFQRTFEKYLFVIVSFAAGSMISTAFLDMLPEALEGQSSSTTIFLFVIIGLISFFLLETLLSWYHCHHHHCDHPHHRKPVEGYVWLNLIGDGIHNFTDGAVIAISFLANFQLGLATTIAVILHEIPQEFGDFGILVNGGLSVRSALFWNFISALAALLGTLIAFFAVNVFQGIEKELLAFAAGGLIYIATVDLLPEIHKTNKSLISIIETIFFILGVILIYVVVKFV